MKPVRVSVRVIVFIFDSPLARLPAGDDALGFRPVERLLAQVADAG